METNTLSSSSDKMIWVKEERIEKTTDEPNAFKVSVPSTADVDDLKDAIKKKIPEDIKCAYNRLKIKVKDGHTYVEIGKVSTKVTDLITKEKPNSDETPIYFTQPPQSSTSKDLKFIPLFDFLFNCVITCHFSLCNECSSFSFYLYY